MPRVPLYGYGSVTSTIARLARSYPPLTFELKAMVSYSSPDEVRLMFDVSGYTVYGESNTQWRERTRGGLLLTC